MHPQLELLLEIQDLQTQRASLLEEPLGSVEADVFAIKVEEALEILEAKIMELVDSLEPAMKIRYARLAEKKTRVVGPVIQGICYGCFMAVPTAWASEADRNLHPRVCPSCGRFLYHVR